jgi:hypothetical protein
VGTAALLALLAGCGNETPPVVEPRPVKTILIELASASDVGAVTGEIKARTESLGHNLDPKTQYGNDFSVPNRFEIGR